MNTDTINDIINAVAAGSIDREAALYRVGTPGLAAHVMQMTDEQLRQGAAMVATTPMQQRCIDSAKVEIAYRCR